ncbi:MAG: peptidyl-prolyl cis-trans isomerase [Pirellulales bacterium]
MPRSRFLFLLTAFAIAPWSVVEGQPAVPTARFAPPELPPAWQGPAAASLTLPASQSPAPAAADGSNLPAQDYQRHRYRQEDASGQDPHPQPSEIRPSSTASSTAAAEPPASPGDDSEGHHKLLPIEGGQIVAHVGGEVVLAAEVLVGWKNFLEENGSQIPPGQLETIRGQFMQNQLERIIETKLLYGDARRAIPEENFPKVEKTLGEQFDEDRLPKLYKSTKTSNLNELAERLHEMGTSVAQQKRSFIESILAQQWLRQQVRSPPDITHDALWTYYQEHLADYEYEAKARWEEVVARFDRFPSQEAARRSLVEWGNLIWFGRATLTEVARKYSQGITADEGGTHDWTTEGSLRSSIVDQAIFSLPVGKLSRILEDNKSYRIVRVQEREPAGRTPFDQAQPDIRKQIRKGQTEAQFEEYLVDLRKKTPVWTIFDDKDASSSEESSSESQGGG